MRPALFACLLVVAGCSQAKPEPTPKAELPKSVQPIEPVAKASPPEAPKEPQVDIPKLKDSLVTHVMTNCRELWADVQESRLAMIRGIMQEESRLEKAAEEARRNLIPQDEAFAMSIMTKINLGKELDLEDWKFAKTHVFECSPEIIYYAQKKRSNFDEVKKHARNPYAFESLRAEFVLNTNELQQRQMVAVAELLGKGFGLDATMERIYRANPVLGELRKETPRTTLLLPPREPASVLAKVEKSLTQKESQALAKIDFWVQKNDFQSAEAEAFACKKDEAIQAIQPAILAATILWRQGKAVAPFAVPQTKHYRKVRAIVALNSLLQQDPQSSESFSWAVSQSPNLASYAPLRKPKGN